MSPSFVLDPVSSPAVAVVPASPSAAALATPAVLLLLFNRPDTTRAVFAAIRQAQPARLYVAADGPRPNRPADIAACAAARAEVASIDWPCQVQTLFQDRNLNCGVGPVTAINWFFSQEEEGIILEDDCVPTPDFFRFCAELLARYRYDARVLHIGGYNSEAAARHTPAPEADSYYFSTHVSSWGWATWRRAWQHYRFDMMGFEDLCAQGHLRKYYGSRAEAYFWRRRFEQVRQAPAPPDVWDFQWHFTVAAHAGLAIMPAVNLVGNIGFGSQATHTLDADDDQAAVPTASLPTVLRHPAVLRDWRRDRQRFRDFVASRVFAKARRLLKRVARRLLLLPALLAVAGVFNHPIHKVHHVVWHPRVVRLRFRSGRSKRGGDDFLLPKGCFRENQQCGLNYIDKNINFNNKIDYVYASFLKRHGEEGRPAYHPGQVLST